MTIHFREFCHFLTIEKACKIWETGELPELFIRTFLLGESSISLIQHPRMSQIHRAAIGKPVNHIVGEIPGVLILQWGSQLF